MYTVGLFAVKGNVFSDLASLQRFSTRNVQTIFGHYHINTLMHVCSEYVIPTMHASVAILRLSVLNYVLWLQSLFLAGIILV